MLEIFPAHLKSIYTEGLYHFTNDKNQIAGSGNKNGECSVVQDKILFTGKNKKNILVLIQDSNNEPSNLVEYPFLKKILQSVSLTEEDIALVTYVKPMPFSQIKKSIPYKIALIFCSDNYLLEEEASIEVYNPTHLDDTLYLLSDTLENLENDVDKKKTLWKALKKIFI